MAWSPKVIPVSKFESGAHLPASGLAGAERKPQQVLEARSSLERLDNYIEFVQYNWYPDVDSGTVFWHDHVDFNSWSQGLFGAQGGRRRQAVPGPMVWESSRVVHRSLNGQITSFHRASSSKIFEMSINK